MKVLILLPECDYDPTESAVPWQAMNEAGVEICFATPKGLAAPADMRLIDMGFSILNPLLMTKACDVQTYRQMAQSEAYLQPLAYREVEPEAFDALLIPGGHNKGMKTLIESGLASQICLHFMQADKPVGAICHGVLALVRCLDAQGKSVLAGRKVTALPALMELSAWFLTFPALGNYYRTYSQNVATEVKAAVEQTNAQGQQGQYYPGSLISQVIAQRDSKENTKSGFVMRDGNLLTARWPGDCNAFAQQWLALLINYQSSKAAA